MGFVFNGNVNCFARTDCVFFLQSNTGTSASCSPAARETRGKMERTNLAADGRSRAAAPQTSTPTARETQRDPGSSRIHLEQVTAPLYLRDGESLINHDSLPAPLAPFEGATDAQAAHQELKQSGENGTAAARSTHS